MRGTTVIALVAVTAGLSATCDRSDPPRDAQDATQAVTDPETFPCAGPDQQALRGAVVELDARCSRQRDPAAETRWLWQQLEGVRVTLQAAFAQRASFMTPLELGPLDLQVELKLGPEVARDACRVEVVEAVTEIAPLALTEGDLVASPEGEVVLDGSRSLSLEPAGLTFRWRHLAGPAAEVRAPEQARSTAVLADPTAPALFELEVRYPAGLRSEPEVVRVVPARDGLILPAAPRLQAPTAVGPGATFDVVASSLQTSETSTLDLRRVRGPSGSCEARAPGQLSCTAPRSPQTLVFRAQVEAAGLRSAPVVAVVRVHAGVGNTAPIADAGIDRSVRPGQRVALDGSHSSDPDGLVELSYRWAQSAGPSVRLACQGATCLFDAPGTETILGFSLVVGDGVAESAPDVVVLRVDPAARNTPPLADAGGDRWATPLTSVVLDGSASRDPDSAVPLTYSWRQVDDGGAPALLAETTAARVSLLTPDVTAVLRFELTVCDGEGACDSDVATLTVAQAGPYVDAVAGAPGGMGTFEEPAASVSQGLAIARRFGFDRLLVASGTYAEAQTLTLHPHLHLTGGFVRRAEGYLREESAISVIVVPSQAKVVVGDGATLEGVELRGSAAMSALPRLALVELAPRTRLVDVRVLGPRAIGTSEAITIREGSRVEIFGGLVRGGDATERSCAVSAAAAVDLTVRDTTIELGDAPETAGLELDSGQLEAEATHIRPSAAAAADLVEAVVGVALQGGVGTLRGVEVDLRGVSGAGMVREAAAVRCSACRLDVDDATTLTGASEVATGGSSTGLVLLDAQSATVAAAVNGGASSPNSTLTAVSGTGGAAVFRGARLSAAADGIAREGVGIWWSGGHLTLDEVTLQARGQAAATGLALIDVAGGALRLASVEVQASRAVGVQIAAAAPPAEPLQVEVSQALAVSGDDVVDALLEGAALVELEVVEASAAGSLSATGLELSGGSQATLRGGVMEVVASGARGGARGVLCRSTISGEATVRLDRTRLRAAGAQATAVEAAGCLIEIGASVLDVAGDTGATAVQTDDSLDLNNVYLKIEGEPCRGVALEAAGVGRLLNSAIEIGCTTAAVLEADQSVDQWLDLHHLAFRTTAGPVMVVDGESRAGTVIELGALRPRFASLREVAALGIDETGHVTDAASPLIDRADPSTATPLDIDAEPRPVGSAPDIGPDEWSP